MKNRKNTILFMGYITFDKSRLVNLEYSLGKEILRTSRTGSYSSTTIVGCNTRKYHGLLVSPVDQLQGEKYVLLSSLDVSIVQGNKTFNIGIHKYGGEYYNPRGHKYITDFDADPVPSMSYEVGAVKVKQERVLSSNSDQLMIRYTLEESPIAVKFQFRPLLAFRGIHDLTIANLDANRKVEHIPNGVKVRMYDKFPFLHMQFSRKVDFIPVPDWNYGIEYIEEQKRGYDFKEDLFVPGFFELKMNIGESIVFSASTKEASPAGLKAKFTREIKIKIPRNNFRNCLLNAAQQFIVKRNNETDIIAGYHWFGNWGRDTFISLPGLTLSHGDLVTCRNVIDTQIKKMKGGLFPNMGNRDNPAFNSVDAPLWFIWAVQQYYRAGGKDTWKMYAEYIKSVIDAYWEGTSFNIGMQENGLILADSPGKALTWMDAVTSSGPVTPRNGYNVEVNALWYNAIMFGLEQAGMNRDREFIRKYETLPEKIRGNYISMFWDNQKGYLADYVSADFQPNMYVRPNMLMAVSLPYSMLDKEQMRMVVDTAEQELLTPRGLRTLSPKNPEYTGIYRGDQDERDRAYHQGTVWPWLTGPFCEAYLRVYGEQGAKKVSNILIRFEEVMNENGISTISEVYDGDPPHIAGGAISQAWSVAEVLRIMDIVDQITVNNSVEL
ncbi:MAG TPA: amylo-alpha-1,6-glucosidase [Bacteroidales bacterium]|nr:amylo-alpha-1,6-glucosidase [Bacteroidales bacterium]